MFGNLHAFYGGYSIVLRYAYEQSFYCPFPLSDRKTPTSFGFGAFSILGMTVVLGISARSYLKFVRSACHGGVEPAGDRCSENNFGVAGHTSQD